MNTRTSPRYARLLAAFMALCLLAGLASPALAQGQLGVVKGGKLHLRANPSLDAQVLATYGSGTQVQITGTEGSWYQVEAPDGLSGYMESQYVYVASSAEVQNGNSYVNLRSGPSQSAAVLGQYNSGTIVTTLSADGSGWTYVDIDGTQGYMSSHFLHPVEASAAPTAALPFTPDTARMVITDGGNSVTHQYGQGESEVYSDHSLVYTIYYPETNLPALDSAIKAWVDLVIKDTRELSKEATDGVEVEVTIQYDSYLTNGRYVGIMETGYIDSAMFAHPSDLIYTANGDLETGSLLAYTDIYTPGRLEDVLALFREGLGNVEDVLLEDSPIDETWLKYSLIRPEGIMVVLPRGEYLAMAAGTISVTLDYGDLTAKGLLALDINATSQQAANPPQGEYLDTAPRRTVDPTRPMVALTFDDGPGDYTEELLAVLDQNNAVATFYMVGNRIQNYSDAVRKVAAQGSEIGTHTWSHKQLTKLSKDGIHSQLKNGMDAISAVTGQPITTMRPPYGSYNKEVRDVSRALGLTIATWSIDTEDWKTNNADSTYNAIMWHVKNGSIILCHETKHSTLNAMKRVIPDLIGKGYQLVTVTELLSYSHTHGEAGMVYTHLDVDKMVIP